MSFASLSLLGLYRSATTALLPLAPALLAWRQRQGKEEAARIGERSGVARTARPPGRLAWLHGASVGEAIALLPLVAKLRQQGLQVLVTTGTVTSARILDERLPAGAIHQYIPLDVCRFVRRFLDHWRPDLVLFAESELWPNALGEAHARRIPVILVNARLSQRSFDRWKKLPHTARQLLSHIDLCLAQSDADAARFSDLGAPRVLVGGNLKYDVAALPADPAEVARMQAMIGSRPLWLAASTHEGEEKIALAVHRQLGQRIPDLVTIIAPRHAERGAQIANLAAQDGLQPYQRSQGDAIPPGAQVYIADTMGELGLLYRLASIVFVGKSLAATGGQNPIEPAKLGAAILHGPHVGNFIEVYDELDRSGGALEVGDRDTLARTLLALMADGQRLRIMVRRAGETVAQLGGASDRIMGALEPYLLQLRVGRR
ncbi:MULTISPECIES: 3-deoxy-D-manno-octulosonic acid transferase [unclassified Beijerinckia]|uniref:3-deoxy-D-manno-octulosonic acid transferase n=1 Tax=unclassified Beijerinckia TaxID=2638183 RepID=UPI000897CD4F|nr:MULTISPECIES: 3-deoxy-D-manno-octulosonic acid transferase [unclassified Beijerinckia]MDH7796699.1 3-deoxy-D-manno-octulosonic-acid transferase [Beijerinckia sp. GAS462]SEC56238.1 3-deoxy-D-manno-octulosonic-acid transferase [Beijerinckia sp. 28-YEA-48]